MSSHHWYEDIECLQWLEPLHPFASVTDLVIYENLVRYVPSSLKELNQECETGVLPALRKLFLEELSLSMSVQDAVDQFIAARQHSGHSLDIPRLDEKGLRLRWDINYR
jgi:hypothetical protein